MNIYTALCKMSPLSSLSGYSCLSSPAAGGAGGVADPFLGSSQMQQIICAKTLFCQAAKSFALILKITINEC